MKHVELSDLVPQLQWQEQTLGIAVSHLVLRW